MNLISKRLVKEHFEDFCHCFFGEPGDKYTIGFQDGVQSVLAFLDVGNDTESNEDNVHDFEVSLELEDLEIMCERGEENKPIWIELLQIDMITPGFIDFINGSVVGVWCASNNPEDGWLYAKDYEKTWLAYENKPSK